MMLKSHTTKINTKNPEPITGRTFLITPESQAIDALAMSELVRLDAQLFSARAGRAITRFLMYIESLASVKLDGVKPSTTQMLYLIFLERLKGASPEDHGAIKRYFPQASSAQLKASYEAYRYYTVLEYIRSYRPNEEGLPYDSIDTLYDLSLRDVDRSSYGREIPERDSQNIQALMHDLIDFCNDKRYSVLTRSIIEHFQLQVIDPYPEKLDRLGRLFALLIWKQNGLITYYIPPFSLTPAMVPRIHTKLLEPQEAEDVKLGITADLAIDEWIYHSSGATVRAVEFSRKCIRELNALQEEWAARLRGVSTQATLSKLFKLIIETPVVNVSYLTEKSDMSFPAVNSLVQKMVDVEILKPVTQGQRNRIFVASQAIDLLENVSAGVYSKKTERPVN